MIAARPEFYTVRGTLRAGASSYVERQADADLLTALLRGEFCYVLTPRQMGKSSLMGHTSRRLRQEGVAVAILDLTAIGRSVTPEEWCGGLLDLLGEDLDLEEELEAFWEEQTRLGPIQRWFTALRQVVLPRVPGRVVIFVDEIDYVRSLPFPTDEFFAAIRACYNRRTEDPELARVTFCLLGVASPSDLMQDPHTTPFNIGQRIELTDFTPAEAQPLAAGLGQDERVGGELLKRVLYWTGGQPCLTQRLCQAVAESGNVTTSDGVDRVCAALFFAPGASGQDDNLTHVRDYLLGSMDDVASLLDLYGQIRQRKRVPDEETNRLVSRLRLSGVVRSVDGTLRVGNRIYERVFDPHWVVTHMPDAEVRRQRAAYRRGVLRTALIAGVIFVVMAALALTAVQQARRAAEGQRMLHRHLYAAQVKVAQQAWEEGSMGRMAELLESQRPRAGEEDLRDFAWRYLWRLCQCDRCTTFRAHRDWVTCVAFSPDGRTLATAGYDGVVNLWNAGGPTPPVTLAKTGEVDVGLTETLAFSPDGKTLVTGGADHVLHLWDLTTRRERASLRGHRGRITSVAFDPDGRIMASGSGDGTVKLWDVTSQRELETLPGQSDEVLSVAFSPDHKTRILASGSNDGTLKLWNVDSRREIGSLEAHTRAVLEAHPRAVNALAFSPDGRTLATGSSDRTVKLWDVGSARQVNTLTGHEGGVTSLAFSSDGRILATGSTDSSVKLWDVTAQREWTTLRGHAKSVLSVAFSPGGETLATGSADATVRVWRIGKTAEPSTLAGHTNTVLSVAFSPDGRTLASGSADRTVRLWDVASLRGRATLRGHASWVTSVTFSPDGKTLASGSGDRTVKLWDVVSGSELATLRGHTGEVASVAFSPGGETLASGSADRTVRLWDVVSRRARATLQGHKSPVTSVAFAPDGKTLASGGLDGSVWLWDAAGNPARLPLEGHNKGVWGVAFSPDGEFLAFGCSDCCVRHWDRDTPTDQQDKELELTGYARCLAFSPDGKNLATDHQGVKPNQGTTIKLWNMETRQEVATFKGRWGHVETLAFSPDGNILAMGSEDRVIRLWRAAARGEADLHPGVSQSLR